MALERGSVPFWIFATLNALAFVTASCTIMHKNIFLDVNTPTGCEYADKGWAIGFAKAGLAVSVIGLGNLVNSWKSDALRKLYRYLAAGLGACTFMILLATFLFATRKPLDEGLRFPILARLFTNQDSWSQTQECLVQNNICEGLVPTPSMSALPDIDPEERFIQYNCCRPPPHCSFLFINGTYWALPVKDKDCQRWMANAGKPTFDADFCKRGFLMSVMDVWARIFLMCFLWSGSFGICIILEEEYRIREIPQHGTKVVVKKLEETYDFAYP